VKENKEGVKIEMEKIYRRMGRGKEGGKGGIMKCEKLERGREVAHTGRTGRCHRTKEMV
jgi:hypothetical protein